MWGGFTEAERLRLLSSGWEDTVDRKQSAVDVRRLEMRLGLRPSGTTIPQQRPPATNGASRLMATRNAAAR